MLLPVMSQLLYLLHALLRPMQVALPWHRAGIKPYTLGQSGCR